VKRGRKVLVLILGSVLGLASLVSLGLYGLGWYRLNRTYTIQPRLPMIPDDPAVLQEGQRIFRYRGCEACHGEDLGGLVYMDNPAIGQVITPNLTSGKGGIGGQRSDQDLVRAIRHGVGSDGKPLLFMPSTEFYFLSDSDLGAVLAYIQGKPPVDNLPGASKLSPAGFIVMNLTREITFLPAELIPHDQIPPSVPEAGATSAYGEYLALSCPVCHGLTMSGGEIPGFPPEWPAAGNLTPGRGSRLPSWGEPGFIDFIRDGEKHGRAVSPDYMPWTSYRYLSDLELKAVYAYLMALPARDFGSR
jgi:mono/diheme cytochrome c family protein